MAQGLQARLRRRCFRRRVTGNSPPVDAAEADAFSMVAVQDFEGVAVEDGDDGASEVSETEIGE
jgi:hypothetical protein